MLAAQKLFLIINGPSMIEYWMAGVKEA
jgi:hypothetical protein